MLVPSSLTRETVYFLFFFALSGLSQICLPRKPCSWLPLVIGCVWSCPYPTPSPLLSWLDMPLSSTPLFKLCTIPMIIFSLLLHTFFLWQFANIYSEFWVELSCAICVCFVLDYHWWSGYQDPELKVPEGDYRCGEPGACVISNHDCRKHSIRPWRRHHGRDWKSCQGSQCLWLHHETAQCEKLG